MACGVLPLLQTNLACASLQSSDERHGSQQAQNESLSKHDENGNEKDKVRYGKTGKDRRRRCKARKSKTAQQ
jgi:hypothetical protein